MIDKYGTWQIGEMFNNQFMRLVVHRSDDKRSFFEAHETKQRNKRNTTHITCIDMTDENLRELRDYLNTLNL